MTMVMTAAATDISCILPRTDLSASACVTSFAARTPDELPMSSLTSSRQASFTVLPSGRSASGSRRYT